MQITDQYNRREPHRLRPGDSRGPSEIDYARVIHSDVFRRLAGITQILPPATNDFSRNRLTHSIEVGQIALGITFHIGTHKFDRKDPLYTPGALTQAIAAVHDIGHPPMGHSGEDALNWLMRDHGGFEGNAQTLHILSRTGGLNLTRRTLLGTLKYPVSYASETPFRWQIETPDALPIAEIISPISGCVTIKHDQHAPPKCYYSADADVVDWLIEPLSPNDQQVLRAKHAKSFDCSIMDLADEFSYVGHDFEDGIVGKRLTRDAVELAVSSSIWNALKQASAKEAAAQLGDRNAFLDDLFTPQCKRTIGNLIHFLISSVSLSLDRDFEDPLYRNRLVLDPPAAALLQALKTLVFDQVIMDPTLQQVRYKGQKMILEVFDALVQAPPQLLPLDHQRAWHTAEDEAAAMRVLCNYIANLTDFSLSRLWQRLYLPEPFTD